MMRSKFLAFGAASLFALGGCGEQTQDGRHPVPVTVTNEHDVEVYASARDAAPGSEAKPIESLRAGATVLALCFKAGRESPDDTVHIGTGEFSGDVLAKDLITPSNTLRRELPVC